MTAKAHETRYYSVQTVPKNVKSQSKNIGFYLTQAELSVVLPNQPQIQKNILYIEPIVQVFRLQPDPLKRAGIYLEISQNGMVATLAGPERATLEVECLVQTGLTISLPLWTITSGDDSEVGLWNNFGKLVVPDMRARSADSNHFELEGGRYFLVAQVDGNSQLQIGMGVSAPALREIDCHPTETRSAG